MTRNPTPRQLRMFRAQVVLTFPAAAAAGYLLPSWWAVVMVPLAWLVPALYGALRDTLDERRARRRRDAMWVHPSTWDAYMCIPERTWPLS